MAASVMNLAVALILLSCAPYHAAVTNAKKYSKPLNPPLQLDFYKHSCSKLHSIVRDRVEYHTKEDITTPAPLLRLFFHDCFVQGCDASVLLESSPKDVAEKEADINFSIDGFDVIGEIKTLVEHECPGVVSCSDILALTAVYAIHKAGGPLYEIELGRRDGLTSYSSSASIFLPKPTLNVSGLLQNFEIAGLDVVDLVALSGAHTIGQGHCRSIKDRISPTIDTAYHGGLGEQLLYNCTVGGVLSAPDFCDKVQFFMDGQTNVIFDNNYFKRLQQGLGVFTSDKVLYEDERTRSLVDIFAYNQTRFFDQFGTSLRKMGKIGVLTGSQGQIRANCSIRNLNINDEP